MAKKFSSKQKNNKNSIKFIFQTFVIAVVLFFGIFTSTLFPDTQFEEIISRTLGQFFDLSTVISTNYIRILESFTIVLFVWMLNKLIQWLIYALVPKKRRKTAGYLLLRSTIKYTLGFLGFIFIVLAWGVESTTLLASLGLVGLVISFGAQGLIEDILSGLFLIMENQYQVGDIVLLDDFRGRVDHLGLRTTRFVDPITLDVRIVNNSEVKSLINLSTELSVSVCDMSIEYGEDLVKVETLINEFLPVLTEKYEVFIEGPKYVGVQALADSAVILRVVTKVKEDDKIIAKRIMNRELKLLFDQNGINIPFPQLVLHKE
jgi:small conductance mechanosensitive channel